MSQRLRDRWWKSGMSRWLPEFCADRRHRDSVVLATFALAAIFQQRVLIEPQWVWLEIGLLCVAIILVSFRTATNAAAAVLLLTPVAMYLAKRIGFGAVAAEMTMLTSLGTAAVATAILARTKRGQSIAVVAAGFIVLFVTAIGENGAFVVSSVAWLAGCVWYLVTNHWERLDLYGHEKVSRNFAMKPVTMLLATLVLLGGGLITYGRMGESDPLTGVMPTSGGSDQSDSDARSGVGTGEIAISGTERPNSFGPVDSDWLLESQESTLFDMFSESLGPPKKTKRHELRQAIGGQPMTELHQHTSKSERGNGSFSVQRDTPPPAALEMKEHREDAIVQWAGPSGVRLAMQRYTTFDGDVWDVGEDAPEELRLRALPQGEQVWFFDPGRYRFLKSDTSRATHQLKVLRLSGTRIPAPGQTAAVHVKDVNREDFFRIERDGSWAMPGRKRIPPLTVIHLCELQLWEDEIIAGIEVADSPEANRVVVSEEVDQLLDRCLRRWAAGVEDPYERLRRCVVGLRSEFRFDRGVRYSGDDALLGFLTTECGGDHLFATTAALLSRKLGLRSRLVTGFYVPPRLGDIATGATNVRAEDVHTWVEVGLADGRWFEIEPTPGYIAPNYRASLWLRGKRFAAAQWPTLVLIVLIAIGGYGTRRVWLDWLLQLVWLISAPLAASRRMTVAMWVIETRAKLLGVPRHAGRPQRDWLVSLTANMESVQETVSHFCAFADRISFSHCSVVTVQPEERTALREIVSLLSMKQLRANYRNELTI